MPFLMYDHPNMTTLSQKSAKLKEILRPWSSALIAYSGGVDSAFLLWTAHEVLGNRVTGILGDSPSLPRSEYQVALNFASRHQLPVEVISTNELNNPDYAANPSNRCFFCRSELFQRMESLATERKVSILAYGENADDAKEIRAGRAAAGQFNVVAPLREADLTKSEIRELARTAGLEISEKPASPCLSSRLAPGLRVSIERLAAIEKAETAVRARGFRIVRVRHLGKKALLQVSPEETPRLLQPDLRKDLMNDLLASGFSEVEFDPAGYQGSGLR
jgi:uncharacterized protein